VNNVPLMQKFPTLFSVSLDIGCTLSQVGVWRNNRWSWKMECIRALFVGESSQTEQLLQLLDNKRLLKEGEGTTDKWLWRDIEYKKFSVKATYNFLLRGGVCSVWVGIICEIWNHRNMVVFKNGRVDLVEVFTVVQRKIWSWVTVKERLVNFWIDVWNLYAV